MRENGKHLPQHPFGIKTFDVKSLRFPKVGSLPVLILALILVAVLADIFLIPQPPPKPDATWTAIQDAHIVRIGIDPSSPPFIADDGTGKLSGFDVALANELANAWNVKIQYDYTGYDGLYDALNAKQFDLILSALPYNPNKTQDVFFSHTYFNDGPVLVVRGDDTTTTALEQLRDKMIAVELGSSGDSVGRKWQKRYNLNLKPYDSAGRALSGLQHGEASAAIVDPIAIIDFQRAGADAGAKTWRIVGNALADENYIIAVRRDSPTLLREINAVIDTLNGNGKLQEMQKENF